MLQQVFQLAILRTILALPLHSVCGTVIGAQLGKAKFLGRLGLRLHGPRMSLYLQSIFPTVLIHGTYDFFAAIAEITKEEWTGALEGAGEAIEISMCVGMLVIWVGALIFARMTLRPLQRVALVNVHACVASGRISPPPFADYLCAGL